MNGTTRPLNWCVYGQIGDIACFDPYPVTYYGADHAYVRESLAMARLCGAPRRMYGCLEAFGWSGGQGVPEGARGTIPAEYRQNVVQAIGAGMNGLTSWVYTLNAGGWQINDACRVEIAKVNALIEQIESDLLLATPIDLATTEVGDVLTGVVGNESWPKQRITAAALLSGPRTIVLALSNHIPASKPEQPVIESARGVTVTLNLPSYLPGVKVFEATEHWLMPFACEVAAGKVTMIIEAIESGRVFVLRGP